MKFLKDIDDNEKVCILSKILPKDIELWIKAKAIGMVDMAEVLTQKN